MYMFLIVTLTLMALMIKYQTSYSILWTYVYVLSIVALISREYTYIAFVVVWQTTRWSHIHRYMYIDATRPWIT